MGHIATILWTRLKTCLLVFLSDFEVQQNGGEKMERCAYFKTFDEKVIEEDPYDERNLELVEV